MFGRSPYGERGLKLQMTNVLSDEACRSPYGERGLKSSQLLVDGVDDDVALLTESVD